MKKRQFLCILLSLFLLCAAASLPCFAATSGGGNGTAYAEGFIENPDSVLSDSEVRALQTAATAAARQLGANIGIIFTSRGLDEDELMARADRLYDANCDRHSDAIILAVDTTLRAYYLRTIGRMNDDLKRSAKDRIEDATVDCLRDSDWDSAALAFLSAVSALDTSDFGKDHGNMVLAEVIVIVIALGIGSATAGVLAYRMNNARRGRNAANYVKDNSFVLNKSADLYLYSTVTKTKVETSSSSGGGGHSSGGSSRGGSGGRF